MACILDRPAPQALFDRVKNAFEANVLGGAPAIPETNEWYAISNAYLAQELFYSIAEQQWREQDPTQNCVDNLVAQAALRGIYPRPATFARGYARITGVAGSAIPGALSVQFGASTYDLDPAFTAPSVMPDAGEAIVRLKAQVAGEDGNAAGTTATGSLVSAVTDIDTAVTIYGGRFCDGLEAETEDEFRTRYLNRLSFRRRERLSQLADDALEYPCATRLFRRSCTCCTEATRIDWFVLFDGTFENGIAPEGVVQDMTDWFFGFPSGSGTGQAPWGVAGAFHSPEPVRVDIAVSGLPCSSSNEGEVIRSRILDLFAEAAPGEQFCTRYIDAIIVQVIGKVCDYELEMSIDGVAICENFVPECNQVPVPGTITVRTSVATTR